MSRLADRISGFVDRATAAVRGMDSTDRAQWAQARTLADLGELTARWLDGELDAQPGYRGPCDVDEADVPGMATTLAACNRAGFVTTNSQAAFDGVGYDGAHWQQRAAVTGFADDTTAARLTDSLADTGVEVRDREQGRRPWQEPTAPVTCRDGQVVTDFGDRESPSDVTDGICHADADAALAAARQLVVFDPEWGRNDRLWPALQDAADQFATNHNTDAADASDDDGM